MRYLLGSAKPLCTDQHTIQRQCLVKHFQCDPRPREPRSHNICLYFCHAMLYTRIWRWWQQFGNMVLEALYYVSWFGYLNFLERYHQLCDPVSLPHTRHPYTGRNENSLNLSLALFRSQSEIKGIHFSRNPSTYTKRA